MPDPRFDLLREPLLTVALDDGAVASLSLPAVLARLAAGAATEFAALRAHQRPAWHAFLVQVGALACARGGGDDRVDVDEDTWRTRLLALTGGAREPWCLVVDDLSKPALLQPPVPEKKLDGFKRVFAQPDALDVLITAKNHDVKSARMSRARPEHWLFALVTLQTTEGFLGKGNYGVSRMNGGFASRPQVGVAKGPGFADRFARDVRAWLDQRDDLVDRYSYDRDGLALLWCDPWDGATSLPLTRLDPFFVEVCRRVRLTAEGARIIARGVSTESARVDAKLNLGVVGDLWIPVKKEDAGKALTVSARGFDYALLTQLLFDGDFAHAAAQSLREEDGVAPVLVARALARGQGETNGLHERVLEIPARVRSYYARADGRQRLGSVARRRVELAAEVRKRALRPALLTLVQADPAKTKLDDSRVDRFTARFEEQVNETFFQDLWRDVELDDDVGEARWLTTLVGLGRAALDDALRTVPLPSERRYRAEAAATRVYEGSARNHFKAAFPPKTEPQREDRPE
jgi:CRISPR system Cascade subunit CasA